MSEHEPRGFQPIPESESSGYSAHLEEQYNNSATVELYGGKLHVVDVQPEQQKSEVPVFVAPGWAANAEVFKDNILGCASEGRRTLSLQNFHGINTENIDEYPNAELRKVAALMKTLDEKKIEKTDVIAHSEGALYTIIAARLYPERFRNIVLVAPAGMIGKDSVARLGVGFSHDVTRQAVNGVIDGEIRKPMLRAFRESGKAMASNPLESVKQVFAIAAAEIHTWLKELKDQGIGIAVIHGVDDKAFPMERVQEVARSEQMHGFYSVKGGHNDIYLKPKQFTALAENALSGLENRKREPKPLSG
ncbi:MAG: alpha/beta hydrolase [Candidatus Andersenbacteria bacterium]|nr:alpha/beta hydrolase [Candidatus Andersenbacteria bacterium]